jgi:hypothetical protein
MQCNKTSLKKTEVDQTRLVRMWKTYINDPSLFTKQPFGQYIHTRIMKSGWCWPKLYYSGQQAYDIVYKHIHHGDEEGIKRVQ